MFEIYALKDPRTNDIRYVGKTSVGIDVRLARHLRDRKKNHRCSWLSHLRKIGLKPIIQLLEECSTEDEANEAEKAWISVLPRFGVQLTNLTEGGDGVIPTPETRRRMSESAKLNAKTPSGKEVLRKNGLKNKTSRREHLQTQKKTAKYKQALKAARKRQWHDPAYRERMSAMVNETWKDPEIAAKRRAGLDRAQSSPKRVENLRKALRDPEIQRRRIETRRRNSLKHK